MTVLATSATTELEAVNTMLLAAGYDTVADLDTDSDASVTAAISTLSRAHREVLMRGWWFNTEYEYPLTRDGSGHIEVPEGALSVDPDGDHLDVDAVVRGTKLYDRKNHTLVFSVDLTATVVFLLNFEEIPQVARDYIVTLAARRFVDSDKVSDTLHRFTKEDEARALANLKSDDAEHGDANILTGSYDVYRALDREI